MLGAAPAGKFGLAHDTERQVSLQVSARSLGELFERAGEALAERMLEGKPVRADAVLERIIVNAANRESLLLEWIAQLIERSRSHGRIYTEFHVRSITEHELEADIAGVACDTEDLPVKDVSYSGLRVQQHGGSWVGHVVLYP